MRGAPESALGVTNPSGWMNSELFLSVLKHIVKHVRPDKDHPVTIVMDNHESHVSLTALEYAKENNIHIVTLPPHTSHRTQPLDRSVFGPMKAYFNVAADSWLLQYPGKVITIYEIADIIRQAWEKAATPSNIIAGFRVSGVWPFNPLAFDDGVFLPAAVTDRPHLAQEYESDAQISSSTVRSSAPTDQTTYPSAQTSTSTAQGSSSTAQGSSSTAQEASTTAQIPASQAAPSSAFTHSPVNVKGFPKAPQRKPPNRGRKRGRSIIATSTPELKRIQNDEQIKESKIRAKSLKVKRQIFEEDSDYDLDMNIADFMSTDENDRDDNIDNEVENHDALVLGNVDYPKIGDHVICEYQLKTAVIYYVGTVTKERNVEHEVELAFLKRVKKNENKFVKPSVEDTWTIHIDQIKAILSPPEFCGTTARTKGVMIFKVNFGNIDLR